MLPKISPLGLGILLTLGVLGLLPFALIAKSRASLSEKAPLHLVFDMDKQPKGKAQRYTPLFADERFMRPQVPGTVAKEDMWLHAETLNDVLGTYELKLANGEQSQVIPDAATYAAVYFGRQRGATMTDEAFKAMPVPSEQQLGDDRTFYVRSIPAVFATTPDWLKRGQERFNVYCSPCHGESGYGDGSVGERAKHLQLTKPDAISGWTNPQNLHEPKMALRPEGHLYSTITNGLRNMPAYDKQISVSDRWAIVAYIRALQRSQNAQAGDTPAAQPR